MKKTTQKKLLFGIGFLVLFGCLILSFEYYQTSFNGSEVKYVVPHLASIKCEEINSEVFFYTLPEEGFWISKDDIGFKSKIVNDISYSVPYSFWESLGKDIRVKTQLCDENKRNCNTAEYNSNFLQLPGEVKVNLNSIDVSKNSLKVSLEKRTIGTLLQWKPTSGGTLTYSADQWGLNIYSTTVGFNTICTSSCDLNCPIQSIRSKIVETSKDTLNFGESVSYIEFWDEPSQISEQLGGTVWDSSEQEFCFGGYIYSAGKIKTETGLSYIYPKDLLRKEDCCNGARTDLTQGYKICEDNNWRTVLPDETLECESVIQCPGNGIPSGQLINGETFKTVYECISNECIEQDPESVECISPNIGCDQDQVCQNFKCVGGNTAGTLINPLKNDSTTKDSCEAKALAQPYFGWTWVESSSEVGIGPYGIGGIFGLTKTETTGQCTPTFAKYYLIGIVLIVLIILIVFALRSPSTRNDYRYYPRYSKRFPTY